MNIFKENTMLETKIFNNAQKPSQLEKDLIVDFLFENLDQFGDPKGDIMKSLNYAVKDSESFGGNVIIAYNDGVLAGAVIVNQTGMKDYIPENILVYIATKRDLRGKGIGKYLMKQTIELVEGNIALHVEPNNPAKFLYENVGFTNKYLEMRLIK